MKKATTIQDNIRRQIQYGWMQYESKGTEEAEDTLPAIFSGETAQDDGDAFSFDMHI